MNQQQLHWPGQLDSTDPDVVEIPGNLQGTIMDGGRGSFTPEVSLVPLPQIHVDFGRNPENHQDMNMFNPQV